MYMYSDMLSYVGLVRSNSFKTNMVVPWVQLQAVNSITSVY